MKNLIVLLLYSVVGSFLFLSCNNTNSSKAENKDSVQVKPADLPRLINIFYLNLIF